MASNGTGGTEQLVEGINQVHVAAASGGIHAKQQGMKASTEGCMRFSAMAAMLSLFFDGRRQAAALAICAGCPVRRECAGLAIASAAEFGVWGGMTESELRRRRPKSPGRSPVIKISRPRGPYRKREAA